MLDVLAAVSGANSCCFRKGSVYMLCELLACLTHIPPLRRKRSLTLLLGYSLGLCQFHSRNLNKGRLYSHWVRFSRIWLQDGTWVEERLGPAISGEEKAVGFKWCLAMKM